MSDSAADSGSLNSPSLQSQSGSLKESEKYVAEDFYTFDQKFSKIFIYILEFQGGEYKFYQNEVQDFHRKDLIQESLKTVIPQKQEYFDDLILQSSIQKGLYIQQYEEQPKPGYTNNPDCVKYFGQFKIDQDLKQKLLQKNQLYVSSNCLLMFMDPFQSFAWPNFVEQMSCEGDLYLEMKRLRNQMLKCTFHNEVVDLSTICYKNIQGQPENYQYGQQQF